MTDGNKRGSAPMDDEKDKDIAQDAGKSSYQSTGDSEQYGTDK